MVPYSLGDFPLDVQRARGVRDGLDTVENSYQLMPGDACSCSSEGRLQGDGYEAGVL